MQIRVHMQIAAVAPISFGHGVACKLRILKPSHLGLND